MTTEKIWNLFGNKVTKPDVSGVDPSADPNAFLTNNAYHWLVLFIDAVYYLFLIAILISAVIYLTAGASDEKTAQAKKGILYSVIGFVVTASALAIVSLVVAKTGELSNVLAGNDVFINLTAIVFQTVSSLSGAIFMVMLLLGGFKYLTGAGNEEQTAGAKKQMINATIGLALTLSAFAIGAAIINLIFGQ
ncbi:MAG: Uncharacterized protein CEN89_150 [Candidatus Berkelbacteria bacterium Licking1014_7]|uniref:Uncharacterized protein n=1 Tax=Candidatus Berkelbacteria bacterium Licking1014_7 TaxID=2017147 RepID=A0A554LK35_9BACT|nr:MAG: Uncharacterized protein CEN89_150 [Candidatus Berkelbacteria bacterium Licking1014_7]